MEVDPNVTHPDTCDCHECRHKWATLVGTAAIGMLSEGNHPTVPAIVRIIERQTGTTPATQTIEAALETWCYWASYTLTKYWTDDQMRNAAQRNTDLLQLDQ